MGRLVKMIKINNLEYNPTATRRSTAARPGNPFASTCSWTGPGRARAKVDVGASVHCNRAIDLPGVYTCEIAFDTPGTRIATLTVEGAGEAYKRDLRLDVIEAVASS